MHLELAKWVWKNLLNPQDVVIDATCGNGKDTLYLAELSCIVYSLDIQRQALQKAKILTKNFNITFLEMSHEDLSRLVLPNLPKLIVYNLGYLPGGDKTITTKTSTTLASIESALQMTEAISITCYPGHEEGKKETDAVLQFVSKLPAQWKVTHHHQLNREKAPCFIHMIKAAANDPPP